ncbi:Uncharacterized protein OBRU01_05760 [Operophtera brumata]|uniref:PWWP domain-containing protein n=1 Tax=Operophtera brumata TaxID=104452 RepID=A0A0L7LLX4_OPEBR|nr:Uncharacterized protein OBRU01_05760 [Operophtera brumata]
MCDQTEISYSDEEVVWVKLGGCWWPGEVVAQDKVSPDVLRSFRKPPIATVKFFQEDAYEYVKNVNSIYKIETSARDVLAKRTTSYHGFYGKICGHVGSVKRKSKRNCVCMMNVALVDVVCDLLSPNCIK